MKKAMILGYAATFLLSVTTAFAAPDVRDFDVYNKTGYTITHIYVNDDTDATTWTDDVLGKNTVLIDEDFIPIDFNGFKAEDCKFDLKVVFENNHEDDSWIIRNVNLCNVGTVKLEYDGKDVLYHTSKTRME